MDPNQDLKAEGRSGSGSREQGRVRGMSVAAQVALMMVLLSGAALLFRSFREVMRIEPGFDAGVLTVRMSLPRPPYGEAATISRFYRELESRVRALPGVVSVSASNHIPLNGALATVDYKVADRPPASEDQLPTAQYRMVTPRFFETMGIPLLAGRAFGDDDREGGAAVGVISRSLARQSFPDRDPVGLHLMVQNPDGFHSVEIVGVAGDVKHGTLEADALPHLYVPYHQAPRSAVVWLANNQYLEVRAAGDALAFADPVRRELAAVDPNVAAADVRETGFYLDGAAAPRRFALVLVSLFAAVALVMAAVGIYGVVSYTAAQRTRETGVRLALGATMRDILASVLGEGVRRTAVGLGVGLLAALAAGRALQGLLYGVAATDPLTYAGVVVLLVAIALAASFLPAWRAARLDPLSALRRE
jgi:putative ABC transport system permease protein